MNGVLAKASLMILATCVLVATNSRAQIPRATPLGVGETAPDFALQDERGHTTTLSDSRGKSPVVLVFYRGYW